MRERAWIRHPAQSPEPPQLDARGGEVLPLASRGGGAAWSRSSLGTAPARLLCLATARPTAWGAWAARCSQGEAGPLGAPPRPRALELAATKAADFTAIFFLILFLLVTMQVARRKTEHDAHWTLNLPANVRLQGVPEKKLRALDAWEVNDAGEGKDAPRQVEP